MNEPRYVSYDRWDEAHRATLDRLTRMERATDALAGAEQVHESIEARLKVLEDAHEGEQESERSRRDRIWVLGLTLVSGVIFPVLVTAVIAFLHLKSPH